MEKLPSINEPSDADTSSEAAVKRDVSVSS
jgi:hypothetical protein